MPASGLAQRSTAERHRIITLAVAIATLSPVGVVAARLIDNPYAALLATFLGSYALVVGTVFILRRRFLDLYRSATLGYPSTARPLHRRAQRGVDELCALGFGVSDVVVAVADTTVLTLPIAVLSRTERPHLATAGFSGTHIITLLMDNRWLVTSNAEVLAHNRIVGIHLAAKDVSQLVAAHEATLAHLALQGVAPASQPAATAAALQIELFAQEAVRGMSSRGEAIRAKRLFVRQSAQQSA